MPLSDRLLQARKRHALSLRDVAERVGVSHTQVANYEKGHDRPDSSMLLRLADALKTPVAFLLRPPRVGEIAPSYRQKASVSEKKKAQVIEEIRDVVERYVEVETILGLHAAPFAWPAGFPVHVETLEQVEDAALKLRAAWQLGTDPIENVLATLEEHGVWVVQIDAHDAFDACAFSVETPQSRPVVVLRQEGLPGDRQRFNACHELGHLVLEMPQQVGETDAAFHKREEAFCHRFAGAFLVPRETFRAALGTARTRITEAEFVAFKERFGMSIRALVRRCYDLGIIPDSYYTNACIEMNKAWGGKREPGTVAVESPLRFTALVRRAEAEGLIARTRAEQLLGRPLLDTVEVGG